MAQRGPRQEPQGAVIADDVHTLNQLGYRQELVRRMSAFSNFAISFSMICILAGGITSFHLSLCGTGGFAIGVGWPLCCALSLLVALSMAQLASAFPTAGGLYHWGSILGGRALGWATAWFNLIGLVAVLAAVNAGTYETFIKSIGSEALGIDPAVFIQNKGAWIGGVAAITLTQALFNHLGIRLTTLLTDFSGYLIFAVSVGLSLAVLFHAPGLHPRNLIDTTHSFAGPQGGDVWPAGLGFFSLFVLGLIHPAYTMTGFDASAHTSEETVGAARTVPRAIIRSVLWSGLFGWLMLGSLVVVMADVPRAAAQGDQVFPWLMRSILPDTPRLLLYVGLFIAQYLCGLATVTSCSRMMYAFARDGGLPFSSHLRRVSPKRGTPVLAIWTTCALCIAMTLFSGVYKTLTALATIYLYISYVLPVACGLYARVVRQRPWIEAAPWSMGRWYTPVASAAILYCLFLIGIGVWPINDDARRALFFLCLSLLLTVGVWFAYERRRFPGPPAAMKVSASRSM